MIKNLEIQAVESISEQVRAIEDRIRTRAYENYLMRDPESNRELEDWLAAERELTSQFLASITEENNCLVIHVDVSNCEAQDIKLMITGEDMLITTSSSRPGFAVIRFPHAVNISDLQAESSEATIRLTAPCLGAQALKQTA